MQIDYALIKNENLIIGSFKAAWQHLKLTGTRSADLSITQRLGHLAMAALDALPIVNCAVWWAEKKLHPLHPIQVLHVSGSPYEQGFQHGKCFRSTIQRLCKEVGMPMIRTFEKKHHRDCLKEGRRLLNNLDPSIMEELCGLSIGSRVSLNDLICLNTFLSVFPEESACSAFAWKNSLEHFDYLGVTNSGPTTTVTQKNIETETLSQANPSTIHTVIFDAKAQCLRIRRGFSSLYPFEIVPYKSLFQEKLPPHGTLDVGRNLDWHIPSLARETFVLVRGGVASVTIPSLITGMTMINHHGVTASYVQYRKPGTNPNRGSIDTPLFLYELLKTSSTAAYVIDSLKAAPLAGSSHLMITDLKAAQVVTTETPHFADKVITTSRKLLSDEMLKAKYQDACTSFCTTYPHLAKYEDQFDFWVAEFAQLRRDQPDPRHRLWQIIRRPQTLFGTLYSRIRESSRFDPEDKEAMILFAKWLFLKQEQCNAHNPHLMDPEIFLQSRIPPHLLEEINAMQAKESPPFTELWTFYAVSPFWRNQLSTSVSEEARAVIEQLPLLYQEWQPTPTISMS